MSKISQIKLIIDIGGLDLLALRVMDHIFGSHKYSKKWNQILEAADPEQYPDILCKLYKVRFNKILNLDQPLSFNEKIQWLKIYDATPIKTRLADKYLVRDWVKEKIGEEYLVPLLGVWDQFDDIDFDSLPNRFFLKCNHGYNYNYPVENKSEFDIKSAKRVFDQWLDTNFAFSSLELQYRDIPRKILAEEYIEQADGKLTDYKIHLFGGVPGIIQVIGDRNPVAHSAKECFLTPQWQPSNRMYHTYDMYEYIPPRPDCLDEMLRISRILAEGFCYVRVDLYELDGQIKFGEMTFTPASGFGRWDGDEQYLVGDWIHLEDILSGGDQRDR